MLSKKFAILAAVAVLSPVLALAEVAAEKSTDKPTTQPARTMPGRLRHEMRDQPPTEEEWKEVVAFMEKHSPYRLEQIQKFKEINPLRNNLRSRIWTQYRQMQEQKKDDEKLYDISLKRFELKDQQFHILQQISKAKGDDRTSLRDELRKNAGELVTLNLQERELRLEKLTQTVEKERQRLDKDQQNREQLVDDQIKQVIGHDPAQREGHRGKGVEPAANSADAK